MLVNQVLELRQYVPEGRVSTGLVALFQQRLVWSITQPKYWRNECGRRVIGLIGIGGGQEAGETLIEALKRECHEEASTDVDVLGAQSTLWVDATGIANEHNLSGEHPEEPMPLLIWQRKVLLRDDHGQTRLTDYINGVYHGILRGKPVPTKDAPGFVLLSAKLMESLQQRPATLRELEANGAEYLGVELDGDTVFELQGSAHYAARYVPLHDLISPGGIS